LWCFKRFRLLFAFFSIIIECPERKNQKQGFVITICAEKREKFLAASTAESTFVKNTEKQSYQECPYSEAEGINRKSP